MLDAADYDGVGELFADGALLDPKAREIARGRDAIASFYRRTVILYDGSPQTDHATTDAEIDVNEGAATATCNSRFVTHQLIDGHRVRIAAGRYADEFARADGRWRFKSRQFFLDESREIAQHLTIEPT